MMFSQTHSGSYLDKSFAINSVNGTHTLLYLFTLFQSSTIIAMPRILKFQDAGQVNVCIIDLGF